MTKRRWAARLALSAAVFVIALGLAELLARWTMEQDFDAALARQDAERMIAQLRGELWRFESDEAVSQAPVSDEGESEDGEPAGEEPEYRLHPFYGFDYGSVDFGQTRDVRKFRQPAAAA